jgi:endonuclease
MHVEGMAINSGARKHHPNIKPNSGHNLFFKVGPGKFRIWEPNADPQPIYREHSSTDVDRHSGEDEEYDQSEISGGSQEFAFERDLRNYLAKNLNSLENGLTLFQDEEFSGIEFPVGGRFIDILAVDAQDNYVVIELKVSRGYDRVVGQILRYMAWVKNNLSSDKKVRGIIVASDVSDDLKLAASLIPNVELFEYTIAMKLFSVKK